MRGRISNNFIINCINTPLVLIKDFNKKMRIKVIYLLIEFLWRYRSGNLEAFVSFFEESQLCLNFERTLNIEFIFFYSSC